jgi:hypothetical protein
VLVPASSNRSKNSRSAGANIWVSRAMGGGPYSVKGM